MKNNYLFHLITDTVAKLLPCAGTQRESTRAQRRILSLFASKFDRLVAVLTKMRRPPTKVSSKQASNGGERTELIAMAGERTNGSGEPNMAFELCGSIIIRNFMQMSLRLRN